MTRDEALRQFRGMTAQWCVPDDCPVSICGGPHVEHRCTNGDLVTGPAGFTCPFCGWIDTSEPSGAA